MAPRGRIGHMRLVTLEGTIGSTTQAETSRPAKAMIIVLILWQIAVVGAI